MTHVKKAFTATKGFVSNHRTILAFVAGAAATAVGVVAMSRMDTESEMDFDVPEIPTDVIA